MPWYYQAAIIVGSVLYFVGFCWCAPQVFHACMDIHPMKNSSDYRMTDGVMPAFFGGCLWPLMSLGVAIRWISVRLVPNNKLARANNGEMQIGLITVVMIIGILVLLVVKLL